MRGGNLRRVLHQVDGFVGADGNQQLHDLFDPVVKRLLRMPALGQFK